MLLSRVIISSDTSVYYIRLFCERNSKFIWFKKFGNLISLSLYANNYTNRNAQLLGISDFRFKPIK